MGCCCSKGVALQSLGRQTECPKCGRIFPPQTSNFQFNEHLDNCLQQSQGLQAQSQEFQGIVYWEKVQEGDKYSWVQKEYNLKIHIDEANITKESFGHKQIWFRLKLEKLRIPWQNGCTVLNISQSKLLATSISELLKLKPKQLHGEVKISFVEDTKVQDAGGLLREWSSLILQEMVKSGYLQKAYTQQVSYRLNPFPTKKGDQAQDQDLKQLFTFLGVMIGKCIFERITINSYFDRPLIKTIIGQQVEFKDMLYYDSELYLSWQYMLTMDPVDVDQLSLYFVQECNGKLHSLKQNGETIRVTKDSLQEFIDLCVLFYTVKSIEPYLSDFLNGLYQVIPKILLNVFQPEELEMILFGLPFIDIQDWKQNTIYKECNEQDQHIVWLWALLESWDQQNLQQFLRFCTGSSRVPVEGFNKLESNRGEVAPFCIQSAIFMEKDPYPKAHTCFNRLELPKYFSEEQLRLYVSATLNEQLLGQFGLE